MRVRIKATIVAVSFVAAAFLATACDREAESSRAAAAAQDSVVAAARTGRKKSSTGYVGLQYDSLPISFTYKGGSVIPRTPSSPAADYDFSHVVTPRGEMIWFDTIATSPTHGPPPHMVRAELTIPPLANDERLFMASCDVNGKLDPLVVAIVVNEPNVTRFTKVRQAWRVSVRGARFDVIPVTRVTCEDPGS